MSTTRRLLVAVLGILGLAAAALGAAPDTAAAQSGPTITVMPAGGLHHGDVVSVALTGATPTGLFGLFQCPASVLGDLESAPSHCTLTRFGSVPASGATNLDVPVAGGFTLGDEWVRCGVAPGDCALVAWSPAGLGELRLGTTIDMERSPVVLDRADQEAGQPIAAHLTGDPSSTVGVAECVVPVGTTVASSTCTAAADVALDGDGFGDTPVTLVDAIPGPAGPVPCRDQTCAVTVFGAGDETLASEPVVTYPADGPLQFTSAPPVQVNPGATLQPTLSGVRNDTLYVAVCASSVATTGDIDTGPCFSPFAAQFGPQQASGTAEVTVPYSPFTGRDGSQVTCGAEPDDCVLAAERASGGFASQPIEWNVPDVVTVAPASGVLDGQTITVTGSGLAPSSEYRVLQCWQSTDPMYCETTVDDAPTVTTSPGGSFTTAVIAHQRFTRTDGTPAVCRDACAVVVQSVDSPETSMARTSYAMAVGSLEATPSTDLRDRQEVSIAGASLMPTYDGPLWWIVQTGQWSLAQCSAHVLDQASVASVFRECTVPPGAGAVTVTGSTLSATIAAQSSFTSLVGKDADCTTGPGACVALLTRVEQDDKVTLVTAPLTFASS